jgi:hypothetical protein
MIQSTAIEKLESLFYNEASPTINTNSWVIDEPTFRRLILNAKGLEKEQIVNAYDRGYKACDLDEALEINKTMFSGERYYEQTYNQDKVTISETKRSIEGIGLNNQTK